MHVHHEMPKTNVDAQLELSSFHHPLNGRMSDSSWMCNFCAIRLMLDNIIRPGTGTSLVLKNRDPGEWLTCLLGVPQGCIAKCLEAV